MKKLLVGFLFLLFSQGSVLFATTLSILNSTNAPFEIVNVSPLSSGNYYTINVESRKLVTDKVQSVTFCLLAFRSDWTKYGIEWWSLTQYEQLAGPLVHTTVQITVDPDLVQNAATIVVMPAYAEVFNSHSVFLYGWQISHTAFISSVNDFTANHTASAFTGETVNTQEDPNGIWCDIKCEATCDWCAFLCAYWGCRNCGCHCSEINGHCHSTCIFGFCPV